LEKNSIFPLLTGTDSLQLTTRRRSTLHHPSLSTKEEGRREREGGGERGGGERGGGERERERRRGERSISKL